MLILYHLLDPNIRERLKLLLENVSEVLVALNQFVSLHQELDVSDLVSSGKLNKLVHEGQQVKIPPIIPPICCNFKWCLVLCVRPN